MVSLKGDVFADIDYLRLFFSLNIDGGQHRVENDKCRKHVDLCVKHFLRKFATANPLERFCGQLHGNGQLLAAASLADWT